MSLFPGPQLGRPTALTLTVAAGVVATALLLLPIFAFGRPPDPVWLPGFYDGADGDDVVTLVTGSAATREGHVAQLSPPSISADVVLPRAAQGDAGIPALGPPRGPPQAARALADHVGSRLESPPLSSFCFSRDSLASSPGCCLPKLLILHVTKLTPDLSRGADRG
jgi:hypothetical protein